MDLIDGHVGVDLDAVEVHGNEPLLDKFEVRAPHFLTGDSSPAMSTERLLSGCPGLLYREAAVSLLANSEVHGRTPKISSLSGSALPGRDHWGACQSVLLAGGGIPGGAVIGSSDRLGAYPASDPQTPENLAATIYQALGLPRSVTWHDTTGRPHFLYGGEPIQGLV